MAVNVDDVTVGENATINIHVTGNTTVIPTGNVTITLNNNKNYTVFLDSEGKGSLNINGLTLGKYDVYVKYNSDKIYAFAFNDTTFNVKNKENSTINITTPDGRINVDTEFTITFNVPKGATGNITVRIGGKEYNITTINSDGVATLTLNDGLSRGIYNITATYNGDDVYRSSTNTTEFGVGVAFVNYETGTDDTGYGSSWSKPVKTISYALTQVSAGDIIYLANVTHNVTSLIKIGMAVSIRGETAESITNNGNSNVIFCVTA